MNKKVFESLHFVFLRRLSRTHIMAARCSHLHICTLLILFLQEFSKFLKNSGPETESFYQFLAPKLTLWVSFRGKKLTHFVSFWSQLFFSSPEFWTIEKEKKKLKHALDYVWEQEKSIWTEICSIEGFLSVSGPRN